MRPLVPGAQEHAQFLEGFPGDLRTLGHAQPLHQSTGLIALGAAQPVEQMARGILQPLLGRVNVKESIDDEGEMDEGDEHLVEFLEA